MQGVLTNFEPKMIGEKHYSYQSNKDASKILYGFIVTIEEAKRTIKGEAYATNTGGSKSWKVGKPHTYNLKENDKAEGGYGISGLKCIEENYQKNTSGNSQIFDLDKESFVISRFAHDMAIKLLSIFTEEERSQIIKGIAENLAKKLTDKELDQLLVNAGREYVSKMSESLAKSVDKVALVVKEMHEERNRKAS